MPNNKLVIGVDAGGTKTNAWLCQANWPPSPQAPSTPVCESVQIIGRGTAGPGNLRAAGFETATHSIWEAIQNAFRDAGLVDTQPVAAACLGVAGAGRSVEQQQLLQWCQTRELATRIKVLGDAAPVLAAACGQATWEQLQSLHGMTLISGTGSLAWGCRGVDTLGELIEARVGGWGYVLGDEGSGYWIAVEGLRAACRAADGVGLETVLLPALLYELKLEAPSELIGAVYGGTLDRRRLAQLAPVIMNLAGSSELAGDQVARGIVTQAAADLARMVEGLLNKLRLTGRNTPLALAGGVLQHGTVLRNMLIDHLQPHQLQIQVVEEPVIGAAYLAASMLWDPKG